jgi:DNA repair protein RadA/Sms
VAQVRLRAERLGLAKCAGRTGERRPSVEDIVATLRTGAPPGPRHHRFDPDHVDRHGRRAPGTVTQVRGSAQALIRFAKTQGAAVILVGHVTKDGQIAGPRVVEHMVDAVVSTSRAKAAIISASCAR